MIGFYLRTGLKRQRLGYFPLFAKYKKVLEKEAACCWFDVNSAVNIYNNKVVFYHEEMIVDICSKQSLHLSVTQHQCKSCHFQVLEKLQSSSLSVGTFFMQLKQHSLQ
jgi:predicted Zn-ribbon and HTH transcriptional regulator